MIQKDQLRRWLVQQVHPAVLVSAILDHYRTNFNTNINTSSALKKDMGVCTKAESFQELENAWTDLQIHVVELLSRPILLSDSNNGSMKKETCVGDDMNNDGFDHSYNDLYHSKSTNSLPIHFKLPQPYIRSFMKLFVQKLENENIPLEESISEFYVELIMSEQMDKSNIEQGLYDNTFNSDSDEYSVDDEDDDGLDISTGNSDNNQTRNPCSVETNFEKSNNVAIAFNDDLSQQYLGFVNTKASMNKNLDADRSNHNKPLTSGLLATDDQSSANIERPGSGQFSKDVPFVTVENTTCEPCGFGNQEVPGQAKDGKEPNLAGLLDFDDLGDFSDYESESDTGSNNIPFKELNGTIQQVNQTEFNDGNIKLLGKNLLDNGHQETKHVSGLHDSTNKQSQSKPLCNNKDTKTTNENESVDNKSLKNPETYVPKTKTKAPRKKHKSRVNKNLDIIAYATTPLQQDTTDNDTLKGGCSPVSRSTAMCPYIFIAESPNIISANGSTGHRTWEAAFALSDYILSGFAQSPSVLSSSWTPSSIIELGAGTGLTGLVAASYFRSQTLVLTDGDDDVVNGLENNVELNTQGLTYTTSCNQYSTTAICKKLWWGNDADFDQVKRIVEKQKGSNNEILVLAADVTYDAAAAPYLVSCINQLLSTPFYFQEQNGSEPSSLSSNTDAVENTHKSKETADVRVLLAATMRSYETFSAFEAQCTKHGLRMELCREYKQPVKSDYFFFQPASPDIFIYQVFKEKAGSSK